jgi:hypothetical protein
MSEHRPTDRELGGMTVNERLVACDLLSRWDEAVRRRSREEMIAVLREVALTETQAQETTDAVSRGASGDTP